MPDPVNQTAQPTVDDCYALHAELRLTSVTGCVGISVDGFFVIIFQNVKKPPLIKFRGWPIKYSIGGGMPRAFAA